MNKIYKLTLFFYLIISTFNVSNSNENFFNEGIKFYENKKPFGGGKFKTLKGFLEWRFSEEREKKDKQDREYKLFKRKKHN